MSVVKNFVIFVVFFVCTIFFRLLFCHFRQEQLKTKSVGSEIYYSYLATWPPFQKGDAPSLRPVTSLSAGDAPRHAPFHKYFNLTLEPPMSKVRTITAQVHGVKLILEC